MILWTMFIETREVDAHAKDVSVFLRDQDWVSDPCGLRVQLLDEVCFSKSINFRQHSIAFGSEKRRKGCLIGFAIGSKFRWCSASSLGTPGMSAGHHAKISQRSRRNSMSALSYALSIFVAITVIFLGSVG